ncbi:MepB family protein [Mammaliicoccus sp. Dog046]|uniref:MepB family protein n=1 Tax=Mammaliicoccus sp. Dog046 TaxID=3034233 RepID=UPI002B262BFA|nr:MepB family protein [Mammaliicoccus sp. Dog046]WQK84481.1 MepB family protein [Mammaliicoccus sp. Dog046]
MFSSITFTQTLLQSHLSASINNIEIEPLNKEYESSHFEINNIYYRSRRAKKTPNKKGYFVVFWIKDEENKNRPYTYSETPDKLIITVHDEQHIGQFIIPKEILLEKKIISHEQSTGKMAMRVYPTWEDDLNPTAIKTQKWQIKYFIDLSDTINVNELHKLYFE